MFVGDGWYEKKIRELSLGRIKRKLDDWCIVALVRVFVSVFKINVFNLSCVIIDNKIYILIYLQNFSVITQTIKTLNN